MKHRAIAIGALVLAGASYATANTIGPDNGKDERAPIKVSTAPSPNPTSTSLAASTATPTQASASSAPTSLLSGVVDEGDSISVFGSGNHTGIYAALRPNVKYAGKAVGGSGLQDMVDRFTGDAALKPAVVTILIGANDMANVGMTWAAYTSSHNISMRSLPTPKSERQPAPRFWSAPSLANVFAAIR